MPSYIEAVLFSEPSGRYHAFMMFAGALIFSSLYAYSTIDGSSATSDWLLFMIAGFVLSGIAESLPKNRRRVAGVLRLTAMGVVASLIALVIVAPEVINPR
jgi:hypothetical protein